MEASFFADWIGASQARLQALDVAILARRAPLDDGCAQPNCDDPLPDGLGDELRAFVGPNVSRNAAPRE